MEKNYFYAIAVSVALVATSCVEEDYGYTSYDVAYQTNFEKTFGEISPNQIWDFSSYNLKRLGLVGGPNASMQTRTQGEDEPYSIDKIVFYPNNKQMPGFDPNATTGNNAGNKDDGKNLSYKSDGIKEWLATQPNNPASPLVFAKPTAAFTVIPFASSEQNWELHLVDLRDGEKTTPFDYTIITNTTDVSKLDKPIVINPDYIQGNFYFYVTYGTTKDENIAVYTGAPQKSTLLQEDYPSIVLGLETGQGKQDYKDLGLFISVPDKDVTQDNPKDPNGDKTIYILKDITKWYMTEDTGTTIDFDFNDIVVAVKYHKKTNIDGTKDGDELNIAANIVSLHGTIPFQITIGTYVFDQMPGMIDEIGVPKDIAVYGDLVKAEGANITDSGYDPDVNNISITVKGGTVSGTSGYTKIHFPEQGECPYMIAVDPNTDIPDEGVTIDASWFQTQPAN